MEKIHIIYKNIVKYLSIFYFELDLSNIEIDPSEVYDQLTNK